MTTLKEPTELSEHVNWLCDGVIFYREVKSITVESVNLLFDRVEELSSNTVFSIVADLRASGRPHYAERKRIVERLRQMRPNLLRVAAVVGNNLIMRAAARFVLQGAGVPLTVHCTIEDAKETLCNDR